MRYERSASVVSRTIAGERLLVPLGTGGVDLRRLFSLNATAAAVWDVLDVPRTAAEVAALLAPRFGVPLDVAEADVERFLAQLEERRLVTRSVPGGG